MAFFRVQPTQTDIEIAEAISRHTNPKLEAAAQILSWDESFEPIEPVVDPLLEKREIAARRDVTPADGRQEVHHRGRSLRAHVLLEPVEQLRALVLRHRHLLRSLLEARRGCQVTDKQHGCGRDGIRGV